MDVMLDIEFIKEHKDIVAKAIVDKKGQDVDLDHLLGLYEELKALRGTLSDINERRNNAASERNIEAGKALKEEAKNVEEKLKIVEKEYVGLMIKIPNIPSPDTPIGKDESGNKIIREWGEKPQFSFKPKAHWDIGKDLDIIDNETAAEVTGARFTYLKGDLALMQFALIQHAFSILTSKEKLEEIANDAGVDVQVTPFIPILPPMMVKAPVMNMMGRLHPLDERYYLKEDDLVLIGSAEHTLGPMHMNKIFDEKDMPVRYVGYSSAFRREAGTYGKDTKGILRQHQFDKMELETFVLPEHSYAEQDFIVAIQEHIMKSLGLPHQTVFICTGDMGLPDHRQVDIETWMPGQDTFRETHTSDLIAGFQPRRLNTRVRRRDGKIEHVHMNDATMIAMGRTLIAILENYQQEDGSVKIPEVLQPYMGKDTITNHATES